MRWLFLFPFAVAMSFGTNVFAENIFPPFVESPITVTFPTNTPGCQSDPSFTVGTNFVYHLRGQVFTNVGDGHIQTTKEGFDGSTDKSTPWKTLTEVLAVYQNGSLESKLRPLYTQNSQAAIDKVSADPAALERMKSMTSKITHMNVIMEVHWTNGVFYSFVDYGSSKGDKVMPFPFTRSGDKYLLAVDKIMDQTCLLNIDSFLNKKIRAQRR